jgi:hypothetical protein
MLKVKGLNSPVKGSMNSPYVQQEGPGNFSAWSFQTVETHHVVSVGVHITSRRKA